MVEAARPNALDGFEWYCFECSAGASPRRSGRHVVRGFAAGHDAFYATRMRALQKCRGIHPGRKPPAGWVKDLIVIL